MFSFWENQYFLIDITLEHLRFEPNHKYNLREQINLTITNLFKVSFFYCNVHTRGWVTSSFLSKSALNLAVLFALKVE